MHHAVVNAGAYFGKNCIINTKMGTIVTTSTFRYGAMHVQHQSAQGIRNLTDLPASPRGMVITHRFNMLKNNLTDLPTSPRVY